MTIIKALQDFLKTYSGMNLQPLATDLPGTQLSKYAIAPSGNGVTKMDIVGNRTYENNYVFYAKENASDEESRAGNYDFLESFSDWIEGQNDTGNLPSFPANYVVESVSVSNAMLMDIEENGDGLYQVQIKLIFTKKKG